MNYTKSLFFIAAGLIPLAAANAQERTYRDSTIQDQTIQIRQIYKPEISRAEKPEWVPTLPKMDTSKPSFRYVVPQQTLSYTYHSIPIRPLALGKQQTESPFPDYIKAGAGNLRSIYVDAGISRFRGDNYESVVHFSHLSQKGKLLNQQSSYTAFKASGKYQAEQHLFGAELNISRRGNTFYGYDTANFEYGTSALKQAFTGGRLTVDAVNLQKNQWNLKYHPRLSFGIYGDLFSGSERSFSFDIPAKILLDETASLSLGIQGNLVQFRNSRVTRGNHLFQIDPAFDLQLKSTQVHIGVSPAFGKDNITYFLPDLRLNAQLFHNRFSILLGWKAKIEQNTFEALSRKNPFIDNVYPIRQSRTDQVFAGMESSVGTHFSYGATISWRQWKHLALFINDYMENPDGKRFQVVYDEKVQALNLEAFAHYQIGRLFSLHAGGSWYNFYRTTTYAKVWHEPMLRLNTALELQPVKKLHARAGLDFWDGMYARAADGSATKLPAFLDLGLSAAYDIIPRCSVFIQLNNILNNTYERWNQYPNYGFNIIGGFRFKF